MRRISILAGLLFLMPLTALAEGDPKTLTDAVVAGDANLNLRYRYEFVDQDGFDENANASTLRIRLNYLSGQWKNWSGFVEMDYVGEVIISAAVKPGIVSADCPSLQKFVRK